MNILNDLLDGTIPSHNVHVCLSVELFGVIFYIDDLTYAGYHAGRVMLRQNLRNATIILRKDLNGTILALVAQDSWIQTYFFNVLGCNVFIEQP